MKWLVLSVFVLLPSLVGAVALLVERRTRASGRLIASLVVTAMVSTLLTLWYPFADDWFLNMLDGYSFPIVALACLTPFAISFAIPVIGLRFFVIKRPIASLRGLFLLFLPTVGVLLVALAATLFPNDGWLAGTAVFLAFKVAYPHLYGLVAGAKPFISPGSELNEFLRLARDAKVRVSFWEIPGTGLNALAVGNGYRSGRIFLTTGLVTRTTPGERLAVIAHEIAHIRHLDWITLQIPEFVFALVLGFMLTFDPSATAWFVLAISAFVVKTWVVSPLYLLLEFRADHYAAKATGSSRLLADALKKIVGTGSAQFGILGPTHPPLQRRLQRLSALP